MIIVELGHQKYQLQSLEDAQTLLAIMEKATPLEYHYEIRQHAIQRDYKIVSTIDVTVSAQEQPLTADKAKQLIQEKEKEKQESSEQQ